MTLGNKFRKIETYMAENKLILNSVKTHLLVMSAGIKHKKHGNYGIILETSAKTIEPKSTEQVRGTNRCVNEETEGEKY